MPKQVYNIQQFHGGLNTGGDPRDIAENELSILTDAMVDEIGKIRLLGGNAVHVAASNPTVDVNSGYGLFYFSHDRAGANERAANFTGIHTAGVASVTMVQNGAGYGVSAPNVSFATDGGGSAAGTANLSTGTVSSVSITNPGAGYTSVPDVTFDPPGSGVTATGITVMEANQAALDDPSSTFIVDGLIGATIRNNSDGSSAVITDNTATTVTGTLAGGTGNNWNVGDVYNITFPETGDDYLVLADTDGDASLSVYSRVTNSWTSSIIDLGTTTGLKPTFYVVDGSLRISDGNFGAVNENKWYGYIDRTLFQNSTSYNIDQWIVESQKIHKPAYSRFANQLLVSAITYTTEHNATVGGSVQFYSVDDDGTLGGTNISRITISYSAVSDNTERGFYGEFDIIAGGHNGSDFTGTTQTGNGGFESGDSYQTDTGTVVLSFDSDGPDIDVDTAEAVDPQKVRVQMQQIEENGTGTLKITNVKYESASGTIVTHSNLGVENVEVELEMGVPNTSDARGWGRSGSGKWKWNVGVSFIYDEKQESLITELEDVYTGTHTGGDSATEMTDSTATFVASDLIGETILNTTKSSHGYITSNTNDDVTVTQLLGGTNDPLIWDGDDNDAYEITKTTVAAISTQAPDIKFMLKYSSSWNPRITGAKLYMRKSQADEISFWHPQIDYDFIKGKATVRMNGYEQDVEYDGSMDEYVWEIPREKLQQPNLVSTFQGETGYKYDEESIISKYKTAVLVNRVVYIGGLQVQREDNTTEIMGDAMIKSPVNKFDVFPLSKVIEVSVRDGDDIIKLEEYADRILQFKKHKMHLVNVSQSVEFLEETFMHKGVSHPAATCKTDFGIAWVNKFGCYLYDGSRVTNLLEKGGRQIIKESEWSTFTTNEPMIGYIPKKRQLIVVDDNTSTGDGSIFLYDLVTQSWTKGSAATFTSADLTNFITDWSGDLVHAHTAGTVLKWDDTSDTSTGVSLITKDMDFGQPAVRKKIYRVYVTYKSGATTNVQVDYDVDGGTSFPYDFTDGTNFASTELASASGWQVAELKPDTSSEANNIKSFRLRFGTDGIVPVGFEINDISVVYRLKGIK